MSQKLISDFYNITKKKISKNIPSITDEINLEEKARLAKNKITYLSYIIDKPLEKIPKSNLYSIFNDKQILFLISFFKRNIPNNEDYFKRLAKEFVLIKKNNFVKVFLQCIEILYLVGETQFIIRGSAGSSLTTYLLNITNIDPIKENISLARFMSETRKNMPDIDMDFPHNKRENIYKKIFEKWEGKVARISNHVMYSDKTSLKQAIRDNGYNKFLPKDFKLSDVVDDEDEQQLIYENAANLEGSLSHYSLHCGGIVIFDNTVPQKYYLQDFSIFRNQKKCDKKLTGPQIHLNKDQVEDEGLIKLDVLSNRGLSQLADISDLLIEDYPDFDEKTLEIFEKGENLGITFGESRGMRKIFMLMKPRNIHDIAIALALIRPSASMNGQKSEFLKDYSSFIADHHKYRGTKTEYFNREEHIDYLIFDDDAIQYISKLLFISEPEADIYRKAFSKNKPRVKAKFIYKLKELHPEFSKDKIDIIVTLLEQLQAYSFCKSHAISYAKLVWALAYQKAHNPQKFWLAALNNCNSSYRKWVHFREAKHSGIKLNIGKRPWKLSNKQSLICNDMQAKFKIDPIKDYWQHGYWTTDEFLPNMYAEYYTETIKKVPTLMVKFRGLVATGRIYNSIRNIKKIKPSEMSGGENIKSENKKPRMITFFTIGVKDGSYLDLVLWGGYPVSKIHCIEGDGIVQDKNTCPWIQVTKFRFSRI